MNIQYRHFLLLSVLTVVVMGSLFSTSGADAEDQQNDQVKLEVPAPELRLVVSEARQALEEISAAITVRDLKKLEGRLLDDGRSLSLEGVKGPKLEKSLQVEVEILKKLDLNTEPQDIRYERTSEYQVELSAEHDIEKAGKREVEFIVWTIPGTTSLAREFIPRSNYHERSTFDRGGNLKVIMKKINGTWAWNPFGW